MLTSKQRSFLSNLAADAEPTVMVGKGGVSDAVAAKLSAELEHHELVKLRFVASKEERKELASALASSVGAELVRVIGNVAVFYRRASDPVKRTVQLPE